MRRAEHTGNQGPCHGLRSARHSTELTRPDCRGQPCSSCLRSRHEQAILFYLSVANWCLIYSLMDRPRPVGAYPLGPRRVFTAPVAATAPEPAGSPSTADGVVETLYVHPSAKIVAFTAGPRNFSISPRGGVPADIEPGSLPWSSQLERTIAVGEYRALIVRYYLATFLTLNRFLLYLQGPRIRSLFELRISPATHPSKESMLVHRRNIEQIHIADTKTAILADRDTRWRCRERPASADVEACS